MPQNVPNINCMMYSRGECMHRAAPYRWFGLVPCIIAFPLSDRRVKPGCALQCEYPRPATPVPPPRKL
jgi:hypothetical protein